MAKKSTKSPGQASLRSSASAAPPPSGGDEAAAARMDEAVRRFRINGDFADLLRVIGGDDNPQFAIQRALSVANRRSVRDALDDLSYLLSKGKTSGFDVLKIREDLERGVNDEYGPHALALVRDQITPILSGLLSACATLPPRNCLVAILGLVARDAADDVIPIENKEFGKEIGIVHARCASCREGSGHIYCPYCLDLALSRVPRESQFCLMVKAGIIKNDAETREEHARMLLTSQPHRFGCAKCNRQPVRPCECLRRVQVPARPREGEILKGKRVASDKDWYCCVQLT